MTESIMPLREYAWEKVLAAPLKNAARQVFFSLLSNLRYGRLTLRDGEVCRTFGGMDPRFSIDATVFVHDPKFYGRVLVGGSVGAGEAYMAGYWSADDLTAVIRIIVLNESIMAEMEKGWARLSAPFQRAFHRMRKDTREGSRANISAHYDLGNDFYRLFLDETMTYSCGIFEGPESTLAEASIAKYDRICRKLALSDADHVLEIGTGWGGFAVHAAAPLWLPGHHDDHLPRAAPAGLGAGRPGGPVGPRHHPLPGLPGPCREFRQAGLHRDDRGRGPPFL